MRVLARVLVAAIFLIGVGNLILSVTHLRDAGTFGFHAHSFVTNGRHSRLGVDSVNAGSDAEKAGIRAGDTLTYEPGFASRVIMNGPVPGDAMTFFDRGKPIALTAVVDESPIPWALFIVALASKLAFLIVGAIVAWRRPDDDAALALSLFLVCVGTGLNFDFVVFAPLAVRFASLLFIQLTFLTGGIGVLAFACWFPRRAQSGLRRTLERLLLPCAIVGFLSTLGGFANVFFLIRGTTLWTSMYSLDYLVIIAAAMTALISSYRDAVREERARMRWVLGTLGLGFSGLVVLFVFLALKIDVPWQQYIALTILAIPFGLGYVILRHRVIDIGFVVNRAVVYTGVSVVVVGTFIVFEWLLGHLVEENSRASGVLQLAGALALGLSVRFIHARVDRYVDDLFFRDRHQAEAAIRRFAHEAGMITDPDVLVTRTVEVATRNARVTGAAFYARLNGRYVPLHSSFANAPNDLDENDEAILEMRTFHEPVDVRATSGVPGLAGFPMMVRGQLAGFLACGEKTTHEALAPDERDALRVLARDAGIALDSLRVTRIERELGFLAGDGELPAGVRLRLASLLSSGEDAGRSGQPARMG